jgi:Na+/H+-dicarboxylate symporter
MQLIDTNMIGIFYNNNFLGAIILGATYVLIMQLDSLFCQLHFIQPFHKVLYHVNSNDLTRVFSTTSPCFRFGVALFNLAKQTPAGIKCDRILTIQLFKELLEVFMLFVVWIIQITPVAIIYLIANAIRSQKNLAKIMKSLGFTIAAFYLGLILQFTVIYCKLYLLLIKRNPLRYYLKGIPAFTMAFASASSAATLPMSISCAVVSGQVTKGIARFCLPLGATGKIKL